MAFRHLLPRLLHHPRITACLGSRLARHCSSLNAASPHHPRRAMLYIPGSDERKILKIPTLGVDCAVLDCEDGVAVNRKEEARHTICKMLKEVDFGLTEACVRVNSVSSGLAEEDLNVIMDAEKLPETLMLPKVEEPSQLEWFAERLDAALKQREMSENFKLVIFVESALGLLNLRDICRKGLELSEITAFTLDGVVFGSDDYVADIGATRTKDATELLVARQTVVMVTKAYDLQAIDLVHIDFKDLDSLRAQCLEGARMGFNGKQVIHPAQIPVVQEAFCPSAEKMEWAEQLIQAFTLHQQEGKGAFTFRGNMIDMPLLRQAENIVQLSQLIKQRKEGGSQGQKNTNTATDKKSEQLEENTTATKSS